MTINDVRFPNGEVRDFASVSELEDYIMERERELRESLRDVAIGLHELDATRVHDKDRFETCREWHCQRAARALIEKSPNETTSARD